MARPALLFDLDGTLVDSALDIATALNRLRADRGGEPLSIAAVRPLVALGARILVAEALGDHAMDAEADLAAFRSHLRAIPADPSAVYPDVAPALKRLEEAGHPMAIVTNKPEMLARKLLNELELTRFFEVIVGGDTVGHPKPAPDPMRYALAQLGTAPMRGLMIGDSPIDARAAASVGMPFLLFSGGYGADDCAAEAIRSRFDRFADLPALIRQVTENTGLSLPPNGDVH